MPLDSVTLFLAGAISSAIAALVIHAGAGADVRRNGLGQARFAAVVHGAAMLILAADREGAGLWLQGLGIALAAASCVLLRIALDRMNGERAGARAPLIAFGAFLVLYWGSIVGSAAAEVQASLGAIGLAAIALLPVPALLRVSALQQGRANLATLVALLFLAMTAAVRGVAVAAGGAPVHMSVPNPLNGALAAALLAGGVGSVLAFVVLLRQREIATLAMLDGLTEVLNRRALHDQVEQVLALAIRRELVCSVLLADLDNFGRINVEYGHRVGDDVLCHFVDLARGVVRREDVLGRYGGEQFAMLLFATPGTGALALTHRLRTALAAKPPRVGGAGITLTASFGVAEVKPGEKLDAAEILRRADAAVEAAKSRGRDCAVSYEEINAAPRTS